jgi:hypothetical protein
MNSQSLNWNKNTGFREELGFETLGSAKLTTVEISYTKLIVFQIPNSKDAKLYHAVADELVHFYIYIRSLSKYRSKLLEIRLVQE